MTTKICFKCGKEKDLSEFYIHPEMADGHLGKCIECTRNDVTDNRSNRREYYSAYEQKRNHRPERKIQKRECRRKRRLEKPEKEKCYRAFYYALAKGTLIRQPCEICGKKAQGHHEDYSKPLEVRWLCFRHHREAHHQTVIVD
jgi:hypothetical protein